MPDYTDIDADNDGIPDNIEAMATSSYRLPSGLDSDLDGLDNNYDNISGFGGNGATPNDQDNDTIPDYLDTDTDNDTSLDIVEANDFNGNCSNDDVITLTGIDTDGDGLDDRFDADNSSVKGTSLYMGNMGSSVGDASPGSFTMVNKCNTSAAERDWRFLPYILKVNYHDIKASLRNGGGLVQWTVSCDRTLNYFIVQKSSDGVNYHEISTVSAGGLLLQQHSFEFFDTALGSSKAYYRIIAVDLHNQQQQSHAVMLRSTDKDEALVYPNPSYGKIFVSIESARETIAFMKLSDAKGKTILQQKQSVNSGTSVAELNSGFKLAPGLYFLEVTIGDKKKQFKVVVL